MAVVLLAAFLIIACLLALRFEKQLTAVLPLATCILILILYVLAFFRRLSWIDYFSTAIVVGAVLRVLFLSGEKKKKLFAQLRELFFAPSAIAAMVLLTGAVLLTGNKIATWWDDLNFWATDVKALYALDGFAAKYTNAASEFGDYPPGIQLLKWWFVHLKPDGFSEGLMFAGYYFGVFVFLTPLLNRLDEALQTQEQILSRLVELQATHGNITDKDAYKKALYAREAEGSTYVDNGITVPHAKTNVVTRPSLAALRLTTPVQYNAEDDGTTDLLFAIAAPENGSLHVDMLARMMQMLMNEDFVEKLKAAKSPKEFLECIDAQEEAQFGTESFTQQAIPQDGYRILAVTACVNGIAHTYMAAEALTKAGDKLGLPTKVETNGSDGAKNILTRAEIAACDGIIVAAEKKVETARFDGKPVLFTRVDDGIHKPEELIKKIAHGEVPVFHAEGGAAAEDDASGKDSFGRSLYKNLMNGVSHMLPFVVGGGIMIALAFLLDDYSINPANFGMNTPVAAFFKTVGGAAFGYMLPILAGFIAMSIADRPGLAVGFAGGVLAMNGTNFTDLAAGSTTGISGGFLAALLAGFAAGYIVQFLKKITEKLPASLNGIRPMLIYPLGGILIVGAMMCAVNPVMGMINTAMTDWLNALGGSSKVLLGAIVAGMMSVDMGGPVNKAAYVFGTAALASGNYEVMAAVMVGGMVPPIAIALSTTFCPRKWTLDERRNGIVNYVMGLCFVSEGAIPYAAADPLRVLPSCVVGSAVAGALSMTFGCALRAPHGGIFVFPVVDHALLYCVALAAGSVVGAVILSLLKKNRTDAA